MEYDNTHEELTSSYFQIFLKALPIALNFCMDMLPYTYGLILFRLKDQPINQAILTLSLSFNNFSFNHLYGVQNAIQAKGSSNLGKCKIQLFWNDFFGILFLGFVLLCLGIFFIINSFSILAFLGFPTELVPYISDFVKKLCIGVAIQQINGIMKSYLITQKIIDLFFYINLANLILFLVFETFFIIYMDLGLNGFIFGFYAKQIIENFSLIFVVFKFNKIKLPEFKNLTIAKNARKNVYFVFCMIVGIYGELFTEEISTYYTALSNKIEYINSWQFFLSIANYQFFVQLGYLSVLRTYCGYCVGEKNKKKFQNYMIRIIVSGYIFNFIISLLVTICNEQIASIYTQRPKSLQYTSDLYKYNVILMPLDFIYMCGNQLLPLIGQEDIVFYFGLIIYPFLVLGFDFLYFFLFQWGIRSLALGWTTAEFILIPFMWSLFWQKAEEYWSRQDSKEISQELLEVSNSQNNQHYFNNLIIFLNISDLHFSNEFVKYKKVFFEILYLKIFKSLINQNKKNQQNMNQKRENQFQQTQHSKILYIDYSIRRSQNKMERVTRKVPYGTRQKMPENVDLENYKRCLKNQQMENQDYEKELEEQKLQRDEGSFFNGNNEGTFWNPYAQNHQQQSVFAKVQKRIPDFFGFAKNKKL